jgi:protein-S-isoprenylcysteine O-methyltransferase Ste14
LLHHSSVACSVARHFQQWKNFLQQKVLRQNVHQYLICVFAGPDYLLLTSICATETVAYMRAKYEEKYAAYEKAVPALFVPGLW